MDTNCTVYVLDDDEPLRDAICTLLDTIGVAAESCASADDFLSAYVPERPGCLVLDVRMPGVGGLALQERLASRRIDIPIIFITGHGDVQTAVRAMRGQAFDFLEKPFNDQHFLERVQEAIEHDIRKHRTRARAASVTARIASLTPREREVLRLIVDGVPYKAIAAELQISEKTVHVHRARIMDKMGVRSLAALLRATMNQPLGSDK